MRSWIFGIGQARLADPGQVALDVGHEDGHAEAAEALGHDLEGDRLARSRRAGHEAVAVGHLRKKEQVLLALCDQHAFERHDVLLVDFPPAHQPRLSSSSPETVRSRVDRNISMVETSSPVQWSLM